MTERTHFQIETAMFVLMILNENSQGLQTVFLLVVHSIFFYCLTQHIQAENVLFKADCGKTYFFSFAYEIFLKIKLN